MSVDSQFRPTRTPEISDAPPVRSQDDYAALAAGDLLLEIPQTTGPPDRGNPGTKRISPAEVKSGLLWQGERPLNPGTPSGVSTEAKAAPETNDWSLKNRVESKPLDSTKNSDLLQRIDERWDALPPSVRERIPVSRAEWRSQQVSKEEKLLLKAGFREAKGQPHGFYVPEARKAVNQLGFDPYRECKPLGEHYGKGPVNPVKEQVQQHELDAVSFFTSKNADVKLRPLDRFDLRAEKQLDSQFPNKSNLRIEKNPNSSFDAIVRLSPEDEGYPTEFKNISRCAAPEKGISRVAQEATKQLGESTPEHRVINGAVFIDARACAGMEETVAKGGFTRLVKNANCSLGYQESADKVGLPAVVHVAVKDNLSVYFHPQWDSTNKCFAEPDEKSVTTKTWES